MARISGGVGNFYVYVHRYASGPKQGQVFYVGKGSGDKNRYKSKSGRNRKWHNTANKYGFTHEILMRFYNENCAFSFEIALIAFIGKENLCNLGDGGEGPSGTSRSKETREKISKSKSGKKLKPRGEDYRKSVSERMSGDKNYWYGKTFSDEHKDNLSKALTGRKLSKEHSISIGIANSNKDVMTFYNESRSTIAVTTGHEMHKSGELSSSEVSMLRKKKRNKARGWILMDG